jgi:hypothetical protein
MALLPDIAGLVLAFTIGLVGEALPIRASGSRC